MLAVQRVERSSYDWTRGSSSRGGSLGYILVDDNVIQRLTQRATSSSETLKELPTIGTLLKSGTAPRANVTSVSDEQRNVPAYLAIIKRITGFSWERIGFLLGCTRQSVYNWTQGEAVKPENARQVAALHETISYVDRGSHAETVALLEHEFGGRSLLDVIKAGEFAIARSLAGKGSGRPTSTWTKMQPQKASGRQDHWTDRVAAQIEDPVDDGAAFVPDNIVKKMRFKLK